MSAAPMPSDLRLALQLAFRHAFDAEGAASGPDALVPDVMRRAWQRVAQEVETLAGPMPRRALFGALAALPVAAGAASASNPDAALIAACEDHNRLVREINASGEKDMDGTPTEAAYLATLDAIAEAEPQTLAGWLAKAEAARVDADEDDHGSLGHQWAWALMHDMRRLVAAGVVR